jgi:hypothetical protein
LIREWLVLLVTAMEQYRTAYLADLPQLPLTVELLMVSAIPAVLMVAIANMLLPRHVRLLHFLRAARVYLSARRNSKRVWYTGLHQLAEVMHVQLFRWGLLLAGYLAVPMIWLASVLQLLQSRIGRRLLYGSRDLGYVQPYLFWIVLGLGTCLALLIAVRGQAPRFGGPLGRFPAILLAGTLVVGGANLASGALADGTLFGPLLLLISFAVPVIVHCNRRVSVRVSVPYWPPWTGMPGAPGDPRVRPLVRSSAPKPRTSQNRPQVASRFKIANRLQIPNRPLRPQVRTRVETTLLLDRDARSAQAAFNADTDIAVELGWESLTPPIQRLDPSDPPQLGPYLVRGRIAVGGMGTVYYAVHSTTGQAAAVKVPRFSGEMTRDELQARLVREIQVLGVVQVFGVAKLLASGVTNGTMWVAMEYVRGPTLEHAVATHGPIATDAYLRFFASRLAEILRDLHATGIMHRDIKPANIILTPQGPVVVDLGISILDQESARVTAHGHLIGTLSYLPPEILLGKPSTPAVDVYAWGCVVAYAAIGDHLFNGPHDALRSRIIAGAWDEGAAERLERRDPEIARLVALATTTDPIRRPYDGQRLLAACSAAQDWLLTRRA